MSFRLKSTQSLAHNVQRIVREQVDRAIEEVDDDSLGVHETIHQVRKRCKKIRGVIRLVRPQMEGTYQKENARFRDAARPLSFVRDRQAMVETYDALLDRFGAEVSPVRLAPIRRELVQRCSNVDEGQLQDRLAEFRRQMQEARAAVDTWPIGQEGFEGIAAGLAKTWGRGRRAMRRAYGKRPTSAQFHTWRKRVKYHRYQCRMLRDIHPRLMKSWHKDFKELSDYLGDDHDLVVLRSTLT
ncbi:MAG: CHAD domain-containing protein, partial [Myxococcota bacterium]